MGTKMKRVIVRVLALSLIIGLTAINSVYAQQSNFQVSPPPIASPEFEAGQVDNKFSTTYVGMSGEGIDLNGVGVNAIFRKAGSDTTAIDFSVGVFMLGGSMDFSGVESDMFMVNFPFSLNGEYQAIRTPSASLIFFAGPTLSLGISSLEYEYTISGTTYSDTFTTTTLLYGMQGGAQFSATMGDFKVSPFAMVQSSAGSSSTSSGGGSTSTSISSFATISYGLDILYVPWNMTLSSILREADKSESNEAIDTTIIQLSWNF